MDFIQNKKCLLSKRPCEKNVKVSSRLGEDTYEANKYDKELLSRLYREFSKLSNNTNTQRKKWEKDLDTISKKIAGWQIKYKKMHTFIH